MPVPEERAGAVLSCALLLALPSGPRAAPLARGQKTKPPEPPPAVDPYTGGDPERLALLGYRSFGPFRFGSTTNELVQARLGDVPILWVETEHFRLGSALAEYTPEEPAESAELKRELDDLRSRMAGFPTRARKLDPWLRLHLFARRMEDLHADFCARLGVLASPPAGGESAGQRAPALTAGEPFTVLLTQKKSTLARFSREFCGQERSDALFHHFSEFDTRFFGVSDESVALTDSDLHYALVHGVTQNLLQSIDGFAHALPPWWQNGLALWFARDREPRIQLFARPASETLPPDELADWEPLVRGRVEAGACLGWREMVDRPSWLEQPFGDNVVLWSRLDYLLREGAAPRLAALLHARGTEPPDCNRALTQATGLDLDGLDRAWREWVTKSYRKKRR